MSSKAQIPLRRLSPKLPRGESHGHKSRKSWTQTMTNHKSRSFGEIHRHTPSRHVEMFATKSVTSRRQTHLCRSNGI